MDKWNFKLWLALNGAQHINTLFCKPINQSKLRWRRVKNYWVQTNEITNGAK